MDSRSFTFGLGIGIIFSVIVIWIVYGVSDFGAKELSKEEIEQKAREYGMEYVSEELWKTETESETTSVSNQPAKYEAETAEVISYSNEEEKATEENLVQENEQEENADSEEPISENSNSGEILESESADKFADITINSGSNARKVCKILAEKGVIEDAFEYEQYLVKNKKTADIRTGNYKIPKNIDFDDLTNIISKKAK